MLRYAASATGAILFVAIAVASARPAAAASRCAHVGMLESSNGRDYVVVFAAEKPQRASFAITLYSKKHAYRLAMDDVSIDIATPLPYDAVRSAPTLVANPDDDPLLAYAVDVATNGAAATCGTDRQQIPSVDDVLHPRFTRTPGQRAFVRQVVTETAALTTVVNPEPRADIVVPACEVPFGGAHMVHLVSPTYPPIAINQQAVGRASVKVTLDETGNVTDASIYESSQNPALDEAAVRAARETTYAPEHFLCTPHGGSYIFVSDFTGRRAGG